MSPTLTRYTFGVLSHRQVQDTEEEGLLVIPNGGKVLLPGDVALAEADGYPIIIFSSGDITFAAHSSTLNIISDVIELFRRRYGVQPQNIQMHIHMFSRQSIANEFIREGKRKGILNIQFGNSLAEFLVQNKVPYYEKSFIVLQIPE